MTLHASLVIEIERVTEKEYRAPRYCCLNTHLVASQQINALSKTSDPFLEHFLQSLVHLVGVRCVRTVSNVYVVGFLTVLLPVHRCDRAVVSG
jgi:hypothetical protein